MTDLKKQEVERLNNYLFQIPPDFEAAKVHREAMKARVPFDIEECAAEENFEKLCIDCQRKGPDQTRYLGLWEDTKLLIAHGDGFPLLFQFLRFIVLLFVLMFIFQGIYFFIVMVVLWSEGDLENRKASIVDILSIDYLVNGENGNEIDQKLVVVYEVLSLLTNIMIIVMIWVFWILQIKLKVKLDEKNKTDADFAVMMYNLPKEITTSDLRKKIIQNIQIQDSDIIYVNKCYEYDKILKIKQNQLKWLQLKMYLYVYRKKKEESGKEFENAYPKSAGFNPCKKFPSEKVIDEHIDQIEKDLVNSKNTLANYWGFSIVVCR